MAHVHSFLPIENALARVLILGSMPGSASLQAEQYYAHPRNAFWPILGELVGAEPSLPYEHRVQALKSAGIAVWDVLKSCTRHNSLDSAIDESSIVTNDFAAFFQAHTHITAVFFNGAKAQQSYQRYVLPVLGTQPLHYQRLPSTSPAHAGATYADKLAAWDAVLAALAAGLHRGVDTCGGSKPPLGRPAP